MDEFVRLLTADVEQDKADPDIIQGDLGIYCDELWQSLDTFFKELGRIKLGGPPDNQWMLELLVVVAAKSFQIAEVLGLLEKEKGE